MNDDENRLYATMHRQQAEGIDALAQHVMAIPPAPEPDVLEVITSLTRSHGNLTDQQIAQIGKLAGYDADGWLFRLNDFLQAQ